jgi:hypothetical protein
MNLTIRKGSFPISIKEVGLKDIGVVEGRCQTIITHQSSPAANTEPV